MKVAFLISKNFNQISAEQKSKNFEGYHKMFNTSVNTSIAWKINNGWQFSHWIYPFCTGWISASFGKVWFVFFFFCLFVHKGHLKCNSLDMAQLICLLYLWWPACVPCFGLCIFWIIRMVFLKIKCFEA